jgi:S-adenosylmethionine:tRNA ribosyltransferase-isomerase
MNRKDFYYDLPRRLIASEPAEKRDHSRLMVLGRFTGGIQHQRFYEIADFLSPGDCLVINDSRVIPARLMGKTASNAKIEMLLHEELPDGRWAVLCKPGRKARPGDILLFGGGALSAVVEEIIEDGLRIVRLTHDSPLGPLLEQIGEMPLPHYIQTAMPAGKTKERYQTIYAANNGSVAAPTAGLHFTDELLEQIKNKGVHIARVTLHVGIGTFKPVKADDITQHHMHDEYCQIAEDQAAVINEAKRRGGRVVAVGTTSCRTLESRAAPDGTVMPGAGRTDIFIYPGYNFRVINGLITNFHLPESTLLMLVSAFAGREQVMAAYQEAIKEEYRLYSFGDAMLVI